MVNKELLELLNQAVARELQVSVQYMLQHTKMEKILRKIKAENKSNYQTEDNQNENMNNPGGKPAGSGGRCIKCSVGEIAECRLGPNGLEF